MMRTAAGVFCVCVASAGSGCGNVGHDDPPVDGRSMESPGVDAPAVDGPPVDGQPGELGSREHPARSCGELAAIGTSSGVYFVRHPVEASSTLQVYCEQTLNGGGWAMLENSIRSDAGMTTTFWQFTYDERLSERGVLAADQNYYNGAMYQIGKQYMDVVVDLQGTVRVAALMTATGINLTTMHLLEPKFVGGISGIYGSQFASGWSSKDHDEDVDSTNNCAHFYGDVAQHYSACWAYNLGADGDADANGSLLDGGVGPHVNNDVLALLGLTAQPGGGIYSQVQRIARFTRW